MIGLMHMNDHTMSMKQNEQLMERENLLSGELMNDSMTSLQMDQLDNFSMDSAIEESDDDDDLLEEEVPIDILSSQIPGMVTPDNIGNVEAAVAKQLAALSAEAREKAYMDMHGVPDCLNETSELIQQSLAELQNEIDNIEEKDAYNLAFSMDPTYVKDEEFRVRFLRADEMDARKAALRIVRHFQVKLDLFGREKLAMTITQDDLNKEDIEALYSGRSRLISTKDRAGRPINFTFAGTFFSADAILRRAFYNVMSDPQLHSSEHGLVSVIYGLGEQASLNPEVCWKLPKLQDALPMRVAAVHMCQTRSFHSSLFAYITMAFNAFTRVRVRVHAGSHDEIMSSLRGYGIDPERLPVDENGQMTGLDDHRQSLILRRARERMQCPRRDRIHVPSIFDMLFGKGTPFQDHPGNIRFRANIAEHQKQYEKVGRGEKLQVAQAIVDNVIISAGMFLKPDSGSWVSVDNTAARNKVGAAFRTMRKSAKDRSLRQAMVERPSQLHL